jgi:hypothetical protein
MQLILVSCVMPLTLTSSNLSLDLFFKLTTEKRQSDRQSHFRQRIFGTYSSYTRSERKVSQFSVFPRTTDRSRHELHEEWEIPMIMCSNKVNGLQLEIMSQICSHLSYPVIFPVCHTALFPSNDEVMK